MTTTRPGLAALAFAALLGVAGCSTPSSAATDKTAPAPAPSASAQGTMAKFPGVNGEIAAADPGLLQVQDGSSQTAVSYDEATTITQEVAGSLADVSVGVCVTAMAQPEESSTETPSATPDFSTPSEITALTIAITQPVDGTCETLGGGPGAMAEGPSTQFGTAQGDGPVTQVGPGGAPSGGAMPDGAMPDGAMPDGAMPTPPAGGRDGASGATPPAGATMLISRPVSGSVTGVDGGVIEVAVTERDGSTATSTVTTTDETTYTTTASADAAALQVGQCVAAMGTADSAGNLAATSLRVSAPSDEGCMKGMQFSKRAGQ